jgi:hypothetical protein
MRQFKQINVVPVGEVKQAISEGFLTSEGIGIENVDFFVTIGINIGSRYTDCLPVWIRQFKACNIVQRGAIPLQQLIGKAKARDKKLKRAIGIGIRHGDSIVQLGGVIEQQFGAINEHAILRPTD